MTASCRRTPLVAAMVMIGLITPPAAPVRGAEPSGATPAKKVDLRQKAIDPADYRDFLGDLQGNILEDHGREHASLIFLKFTGDRSAVAAWVKDFAAKNVTSASGQKTPGPFAAFYLFDDWLRKARCPREEIPRGRRLHLRHEEPAQP